MDGGQRIGDAWRRRWDSLRLFTPARYNELPGMPFPGDPDALPGKDAVADYLEAYAAKLRLPVELGVRVTGLNRNGDGYLVKTDSGEWMARTAVVATGAYQRPFVPPIARELPEGVVQLHSTEYRNPGQLPRGPVLVVGTGNSGAQIATARIFWSTASWMSPATWLSNTRTVRSADRPGPCRRVQTYVGWAPCTSIDCLAAVAA